MTSSSNCLKINLAKYGSKFIGMFSLSDVRVWVDELKLWSTFYFLCNCHRRLRISNRKMRRNIFGQMLHIPNIFTSPLFQFVIVNAIRWPVFHTFTCIIQSMRYILVFIVRNLIVTWPLSHLMPNVYISYYVNESIWYFLCMCVLLHG